MRRAPFSYTDHEIMSRHISVLLNESIDALNIQPDGIYVDGTFGAGGHSKLILSHLKKGHLYAFDQDPESYDKVEESFKNDVRFTLIKRNFRTLKQSLNELNITSIDGILLDLGMSSMHIDQANRGFSYLQEGPLDMRMNPNQTLKASDILNHYELEALTQILIEYGEVEHPYKVAKTLILKRPYYTTTDLVKVTDSLFKNSKGHSAKKVFQALRIAVNDELQALKEVLDQAISLLKPKGRLVVISFHSLEDRIVKHTMIRESKPVQIKGLPILMEQKMPLKLITNKPILPSSEEIQFNSRSASAKLRVAEKQ